MAFATEMPIAMMAPMNDCTFSVVPVTSSISSTPQITAGTAETTASASRNDWKFAASSRKMTTTDSSKPGPQAGKRLFERRNLAAQVEHVTPRGGVAGARDRAR